MIEACISRLTQGSLPPWKVEDELVSGYGIAPPEHFRVAAHCRRSFLEQVTGEKFHFIDLPGKPYKTRWHCPCDDLVWELDARDKNHTCSLCGGGLEPLDECSPLVSNYVGGEEIYFSYAGRIQVKGDVEATFTNLLVYGTGMGPIGITRGCHLINQMGGAEVHVADRARAVRCNGYLFKNRELQEKARSLIEGRLPQIRSEMEGQIKEFSGRIGAVEFEPVEESGEYILYIDFIAEFENFRGHGDISRAVGFAKGKIDAILREEGVEYELSVIAQGHDGDLKPSPRNKRGRFASAEIRIPAEEFESLLKVDRDKFLAFVRVDSIGAEKLGCQFYSGMGGEIIPAVYKATQVNPQSPLVSSFQNIFADLERGDVVYRVELPNVEVGIASTREGLISPVGREAMRIMGVRTAKDFAASLAAQVLAGEFNLALEISREKLYSS